MPDDLDLLQGSWTITSLEVDGQKMPADTLTAGRIAVKGKRFDCTGMGAIYKGTITLDESTKPRQLNMKFDAGPEKGNTNPCIYELKGDKWKLCIATRGTVRPSRFTSPPGSGFAVETLVRGDGAAVVKTKAPAAKKAAPVAASTAPATEFEGEWPMISGVMNGVPMEKSLVKWVTRVTQGDQTTVIAGPQVMMKVEFTSDASKSPKAIDYLNLAGAHKGKRQLGIYRFEGDVLTVCVAAPGDGRPAKFESVKGDGRTLTAWKRP